MARHKSALKQLRAGKRRYNRNITIKSKLKTLERKVKQSMPTKDTEKTKSNLKEAISSIQRAASRKIIPHNTASRKISRLVKLTQKTLSTNV